MKKSMVVIVLVVIVGILVTAAAPVPPPTQSLQGILRWQHANVCGVSDFVSNEAMINVYLTGKFTPTKGTLQGCQIAAQGFYFRTGPCDYFFVDKYQYSCTTALNKVTDH